MSEKRTIARMIVDRAKERLIERENRKERIMSRYGVGDSGGKDVPQQAALVLSSDIALRRIDRGYIANQGGRQYAFENAHTLADWIVKEWGESSSEVVDNG